MASIDFSAEIRDLRSTYASIAEVSDIEGMRRAIEDLSEQAGAPELWDDPENAQKITSSLSHKQADLARLLKIEEALDELEIMVELSEEDSDAEALADAEKELSTIRAKLAELEVLTLLSGEYDQRDAVVS